jgi:C-terminal processing protease CtpA/Prc
LALLTILPLTAVAGQGARPVSAATRDSVVEGVLRALDRAYVFPAMAADMRRAVEARRARGAYDGIGTGRALADTLTHDLQAVSRDKHIRVRYAPSGGPPPRNPTPEEMRSAAREQGYGIGRVEVMEGNVGYLELTSFAFPPDLVDSALAAAMTRLAGTSALVVDVRRNGGGSPHAVALVSSYLFGEEPVHLNSLFFRPAERTDSFFTRRALRGPRWSATRPVYVLTSERTFSAAEEFSYNLQARKRATIVGETTGGGAHPGGMEPVTAEFGVFVPSGRAINPITGTNWEGVGVKPQLAVPADSALAAALSAIRSRRMVS